MARKARVDPASRPAASRTQWRLQIQAIRELAARQAQEILARPNVLYVTVGDRRVGGRRTGELGLVAYVTRKGGVTGPEAIPASFNLRLPDGTDLEVRTDVVELPGIPQALNMRAGHIIRAADRDLGICGYTFARGGRNYVATNAHVVAKLGQPGLPGEPQVQDPATLEFRQIGRTIYRSAVTAGTPMVEDLAVVEASMVLVDPYAVVGEAQPISAIADFASTRGSRFWYKVNGAKIWCSYPEPTVAGTSVPITVDGATFPYADFWKLQVDRGSVARGHSGSLICTGTGSNIIACGLLFGGIPPSYVYAFPMDDVVRRIDSIVP